jgi:hypothetical protein
MQLGWADNLFQGDSTNGDGVGDDAHSWAYDGVRQQCWNGESAEYGDQVHYTPTLYSIHCTLYTILIHCTLYAILIHCTPTLYSYTVLYTLYSSGRRAMWLAARCRLVRRPWHPARRDPKRAPVKTAALARHWWRP